MATKRTSSGIPLATPLAVVAVAVAAVAALLFPLTGTPGPEAAQILSVVGGPALFVAGAARGAHRHERGYLGDVLVQLVVVAIVFAGFVATIGIAALGRESCAPDRGFVPFFVLSLPVLVFTSTFGILLGRSIPSPRAAALCAVAVLVGNAVWSFVDWRLEPSFRFFSHFFVAIPGDMLEGQPLVGAQAGFRFATALFALAFAFVGAALHPAQRRSGGLSTGQRGTPWPLVLALATFVIAFVVDSVSIERAGPSRDDLDDDYTLARTRGLLTVRADPRAMSVRDVDALLAEGTLWLDRLAVRMGVTPSEPVTIWLHASADAMARYTGARHVHFALPFKRELHVAGVAVPHPSLGHELVHVLGRELSDGVLGVPSRFFVLMHAGIVEGTAMALTSELEVRDGLTLREQAAALRRARLAPPVAELFDDTTSMLGFWRHAPGRAYTTAGALVEALLAEKGIDGLAAIYREGRLGAAFSDDAELARFIEAHEGSLERHKLPPDAVASVKLVHARPSILEETCDRAKIDAALDVRAAARAGDLERALALARDAEDGAIAAATYASLADEARVLDDDDAAERMLRLAVEATPEDDPRGRAARLQALGDTLWLRGDRHEAIAVWERIDTRALAPYPTRLVEARLLLAEEARARAGRSDLAESAVRFLVRAYDDADDTARLMRLVADLATKTLSTEADARLVAFARYLVGRQAVQRGDLDDGLDLLLRAVEHEDTLSPAFREEALRGLAMAHARRGDVDVAAVGLERLAEMARRPALKVELRDRLERTTRSRAARDIPRTDVRAGDRHLLGIGRAGPF